MDLLLHSFGNVFQFDVMLVIAMGVAVGITIGALPGLTATMGVALLVPLTFGRPPLESLAMLLGLYCGAMYGGSISAILVRTPGTPAAAATVLEGYPMAQRGEAGRALAMALFASFVGGLTGALIMTFLSPMISHVALEFSTVEYFALAVFGLSVIVSISGKSIVKGLMTGVFGLLISTIGADPISGYPRYIFGQMDLFEGPPFIPTLIGLFAVSEVLANVQVKQSLERITAVVDRYLPNWADIKASVVSLVRGSLLGTMIGAIPGAGGDIAAFVSYGETKRTSKHPEKFGTGQIEGIAASECANNACSGGAMIPLLSLGVPGDAVTAVLLGAFVIQGLQPGPLLYKEHIDIVYNVFAAMIVANFAMLAIGMAGIRLFAKVILVRRSILMPSILVLSVVGAYAMRRDVFDVYFMLGCGIAGYFMQKYDFPLSPILLALILGPMAEANLRRSLVVSGGDFGIILTRPIAVALLALAVASLVAAFYNHRKIARRLAAQEPGGAPE